MFFKSNKQKSIDYSGSSEALKKNVDILKVINNRFIIVFMVCVLLMSVLLGQLYNVQIINQNYYETLLSTYSTNYLSSDSQRGDIYDRNNVLMATSSTRNVITYAKTQELTESENWEIAYRFVDHFNVTLDSQTTDDLKILYINLHEDVLKANLDATIIENYKTGAISAGEYTIELKALITDEMLSSLTERQKRAFVVKQIIDSASSTSFNIVLNNATNEEIAYFTEHISDFPGFIYLQDWDRNYNSEYLAGVIGNITTSSQGLLADSSTYLQALDYSLNSRVGRSGLEKQYEALLSGKKTKYEAVISSSGNIVYQEVVDGSKGLTLLTSFDLEYQAKLEKMTAEWMETQTNIAGRSEMNRVYIVVQKPATGEILAAVSMVRNEDGTYSNDPTAVFTNALLGGSIVKGATLYTSFDNNVVSTADKVNDTVWNIKGTKSIMSWRVLGWIDYLDALAMSSNVFMWEMATRLAGGKYVQDEALVLPDLVTAFATLRNTFSQFGLGTLTQVDYPNEASGYSGSTDQGNNLLDYVIGQYESYTPIQMSQYVSTIANDGNRVKPRIVLEAVDPLTGNVVWQNENEILNTLSNATALKYIQDGFRYCVTKRSNGLCRTYDSGFASNIELYAKSGTAQTYVNGVEYYNQNAISYTKVDGETDISIVVAIPFSTSASANLSSPISYILNQSYKLYYND